MRFTINGISYGGSAEADDDAALTPVALRDVLIDALRTDPTRLVPTPAGSDHEAAAVDVVQSMLTREQMLQAMAILRVVANRADIELRIRTLALFAELGSSFGELHGGVTAADRVAA